MKREICCDSCAKRWRDAMGVRPGDDPVEVAAMHARGEAQKHVRGMLRTIGALCDGCGCELPEGSQVTCVTIYSNENPYHPWESHFVEVA